MQRLEEYVMAMADRTEDMDIHEQLRQKERDLVLAAELGKALLDKNEEISRQNERITEEYSQKLEVSAERIVIFWGNTHSPIFRKCIIITRPLLQSHPHLIQRHNYNNIYDRQPRLTDDKGLIYDSWLSCTYIATLSLII